MNRLEKKAFVESFSDVLPQEPLVLVVKHSGLNVKQEREFRAQLRAVGGSYKVVKNTLARIVTKKIGYQEAETLLVGPAGLVYGAEPSAIAKVVVDFCKQSGKLSCAGGFWEGARVGKAGVEHLATLPNMNGMRSRLLWMLKSQAAAMARVLAAYVEKQAA